MRKLILACFNNRYKKVFHQFLLSDTKSHNDRKTSDLKKDANCDNSKLDVDGRQSSDNRKGAGNRRNNLPPRLSGKSNSNSTGQNHGNSGNYTSNSYSSGPGYNNSGDGGGGNNTNSLPYSSSNSHSGYGANNTGHEYSSTNHNQHNNHHHHHHHNHHHQQQQNRYGGCNSSHTNYNNSTSSANNCGVIGNNQNYNSSHHQQGSSNFHNASPAGDSGQGSGTTHGPNHVLSNNTPSHYLQSQHRYNTNNNSSTSIHNKLPAYQNYHGDPRQSGMAHNTNMRSPRNFSNNPGQVQTAQPSNYFNVNVNISGQQSQQHYTNELNARYSSYNQKDMHHQNAGSDNPNKILSRDYHNHHQKQQQQQQFSASMKHPRKVLSNLNVSDSTGNENRHFGYDGVGGGGRTGHNYNSTSRPKGGGVEIGGASHKKQIDMDSADYKYQDRKNSHSPNTVSCCILI